MTVLVFERYPVDRRSVDDAAALLGELIAVMREQPGLLWADGGRAFEDDPSFVVLAEWRTPADADAWQRSSEAAAAERLDVHLRGDVTRRRFSA